MTITINTRKLVRAYRKRARHLASLPAVEGVTSPDAARLQELCDAIGKWVKANPDAPFTLDVHDEIKGSLNPPRTRYEARQRAAQAERQAVKAAEAVQAE